jgi:hypothetical protein
MKIINFIGDLIVYAFVLTSYLIGVILILLGVVISFGIITAFVGIPVIFLGYTIYRNGERVVGNYLSR